MYGDINMDGDGFAETSTRVIIKSGGFKEYMPDTVCEAALDINAIHLFDKDTEESIMPRIPEYNYLDCKVQNGNITFLGNTLPLPPAIECGDGVGEMLIPVSAVNFDGGIKAKVFGSENINGQILLSLEINGGRIYALSEKVIEEGIVNIGIDFKKLILKTDGKEILPMPLTNGLDGTFVADKGANRGEKIFSLLIDGVKFAAPEEVYSKMFAATTGRKVYNSQFRYEWSPYDIAVADSGLKAEVEKMLDYGKEKFAKCRVGDETLYVKADKDIEGTVFLSPDAGKVSVIESQRQIRIV